MTKKSTKTLTDDEACVELFKTYLDYIKKMDDLNMKMLCNNVDFIKTQIDFHYKNEPSKLFKKSHKEWEQKLEELENNLMMAYKRIEDELHENMEFIDKLKGKKKEPSNC